MFSHFRPVIAWGLVCVTAVAQVAPVRLIAAESRGRPSAKVPDVVGLSAKEARTRIEAAGLVPEFRLGKAPVQASDAFRVYHAEPKAGTEVATGRWSRAQSTTRRPSRLRRS